MLKSQYDSTDIYSDEQENSQVLLTLDSADRAWSSLFLKPEASDFKIYHRNTYYPLHRVIVFKHINLHVLDDSEDENSLQAPEQFKPEILTGVISCLYGLELRLCRSQVLKALDVVHFLKIAKLKRLIELDIIDNFEEYELFPVFQKAKTMGLEEIQSLCLKQLELEGFEQMRYSKYELLSCSEPIFKLVVHRHNQRRWEDPAFGQTDKSIQELIQQYCKHNNYTERKKSQLMKSFNQMSIKSEIPPMGNLNIPPLKLKQSIEIKIKVYTPRVMTTESLITPPASFFKSLKYDDQGSAKSMIMDLTFMSNHKRRRSNRASQNNSSQSRLCSDVIALRETYKKQVQDVDELKDTLDHIQKQISQKDIESQNSKFRLSEIERLLEDCETQIMEGNKAIQMLELRSNKVAFRKLRDCESFQTEGTDSSNSDEDSDKDKDKEQQGKEKKSQNPKDQKLRVSLIQSKWVCC